MSETSRTNKDATNAPGSKGGSFSGSGYVQPIHFAQSGWRVAVALLAPSLLGIWIDDKLDVKPTFTVIGLFIGLAAVAVVLKRFVNSKFGDQE